MFRWNDVDETILEDVTLKMYREPYEAERTTKVPSKGLELDHLAFKHLGSELLMYKLMDLNWIEYMEQRGDMDRINLIEIPVQDKA